MVSISAQLAAKKVSDTIRRKKVVKMGKILKEVGYSDATADTPGLVTRTKSFQNALAIEKKSILENLDIEIAAIQKAISEKDLKREDYRTLRGALDLAIKNKQLLSGGATERQIFVLPSEVMTRNVIASSDPVVALPASGTSNIVPEQSAITPNEQPANVSEGTPNIVPEHVQEMPASTPTNSK